MDRRGQMRIIEALIACGLILIGHQVISHFAVSTHSVKDTELETMGQNLLNMLEDQDIILSIINQEGDGASSLKELVESILPPGVLYNISIASLVSGEVLAEGITNIGYSDNTSSLDATSVQGVYTFSYPLIQMEDVLLDIVMAIDRSGSMSDPIPGDPYNKIYYAKEAACNFIDRLNATTDRVGFVTFGTVSNVEVEITYDHDYVKTKINNLVPSGWTNIGDGINDTNIQFVTHGRDEALWVMILLSDGKANRPSPEAYAREYALNQSQIAQNMGVWIYTIGLGAKDDIDEALLKDIQTDGYFYAPSAKDLGDIYQAIAEDLIFEVKYDVVYIQITLMKP